MCTPHFNSLAIQILSIICKALNCHAPSELTNLLHHYAPVICHIRSAAANLLTPSHPHRAHHLLGQRLHCSPHLPPPHHFRKSFPLAFRNQLKHHLFKANTWLLLLPQVSKLLLGVMEYNLGVIIHYVTLVSLLYSSIWFEMVFIHYKAWEEKKESPGHHFLSWWWLFY